jgi:hypothetical protein
LLKNISIIILNVLLFTSCLQLDDDVVTELQSPEEPEWVFITKSDGLSQDTVTTMLKDSNGFDILDAKSGYTVSSFQKDFLGKQSKAQTILR